MLVKIPYGEGELELELENPRVMEAKQMPVIEDSEKKLVEAFGKPIASPSLGKLTRDRRKILVIVPDNTRAFPFKLAVPPLLRTIRENNPDAEVKILIATGLHLKVSRDELERMLGKEILEEYEVINHDASDEEGIARLDGKTSRGTPLEVNELVLKSDLVIGAGLIEPHFFAGYSGGRKIILPGVAGRDAVFHNHGFEMIGHPKSRAGILEGNPIHEDMVEFMKLTRLDFIVNVTIDKEKRLTGVFAGDPVKAHLEGVRFLDNHVKVPVEREADVVITTNGGYPLDRDVYQAVKGMDAAAGAVRKGGVIIIASECRDGLGGHEEFLELVRGAESPGEILRRIREREPIYDQWEAQVLARVLMKAKVILVSEYISEKTARELLLEKARDMREALEIAKNILNKRNPEITVIPEGPYVIPT